MFESIQVQPKRNITTSTWWLWLFRILWLVLVPAALAIFIYAIPIRYESFFRGTLGLTVEQGPNGSILLNPAPSSTARVAGIRKGDELLAIDRRFVTGRPVYEVARLLRYSEERSNLMIRIAGGEILTVPVSKSRGWAEMATNGVSLARILIGLDIILVAGFTLLAVLIFARKYDDWFAILASIVLVLLSTRVSPEFATLTDRYPEWTAPITPIQYAGIVSMQFLMLLFPNMRFQPGWMKYVAFVVPFYTILDTLILWPFLPQGVTNIILLVLDPIYVAIAIYSQIYRNSRATNLLERQQTRWILYGILVGFIGLYSYVILRSLVPELAGFTRASLRFEVIGRLFAYAALLTVPITMAVSILRYRLWNIDIIIRRTLVYSILTLALGLLYLGTVIIVGRVFTLLTGRQQDTLVTAISTLVVAVAFAPLRTRVQENIDRRFYRQKYDTAIVLENFGAVARDEVRLDRLTELLVEVIENTIQPESASIWLNMKTGQSKAFQVESGKQISSSIRSDSQ